MPFQLKSVRAKLAVLVLSSIGVMLVVLPILSTILHNQLIDEVDNRVEDAKAGFQSELNDDLLDQDLTVRVMVGDSDTERALKTRDAAAARTLAGVFASVYPEMDIVLADTDGKVLTQLGVTAPPERIDSITELAGLIKGHDFDGVVEHGCEKPGSTAPPAYVMARVIPGAGSVVVCQPFNVPYLEDAKEKLGLELALLRPGTTDLINATSHFPLATLNKITTSSSLAEEGETTWALIRFEPKKMAGYGIAPALDVTTIRVIVRRNLTYALVLLAIAAIVSVGVGTRLAGTMSSAIKRLKDALKRLEVQDYAHVVAVKTGDELEDLALGFNRMVDGLKAYDNMKAKMGKHMSKKVMQYLLTHEESLGGEKLVVTILFSDIRSFTSISEKMDAQQLVALLNEYFTEMVAIVIEQDGSVDKFIGDAIMVLFGAPEPEHDAPLRAVRTAVGMRRALVKLNERLKARGFEPLRTGIGVHTGEVVAGSIGHAERREYTVIGDAVNLASRLESATKELGVSVLISEDTYNLTKGEIEARPVKQIHVKGRAQPVMTYEVLGMKGEPLLESAQARAEASLGSSA
jgi:adenylate cyclase